MPSATIIGAGPAGCAAAILLARARWHVTLVEQHPFPRHKVCGECLSHLAHQVLTRLNIPLENALPLTRTLLHAPDGSSAQIPLPHPMLGLSRHQLDPLLLSVALAAGVTLLQPHRCERLLPSFRNPQSQIRNLTTNAITTIDSDHLLLADGRAALLPTRPPPTHDLGIKAHFSHVDSPRDAIELFALPGHYLGLAPIESDLSNVAYSLPQSHLRPHHGNLDSLFQQLLTQNPALAKAFRHAIRITDWLASPLPRFPVQSHWPPGVIPLGNAAASLEPIGGEGIGLALRSAELAANALLTAGPDPTHPALSQLRTAYRQLWRTRRPACRTGALALSHPALSSTAIALLNTFPSLAKPSLYLMGK